MSDYISREAAIKAIQEEVPLSKFMKRSISSASHAMGELCEVLDALPAADVRENKRGKWQHTTEPCGWREYECASCSVCGESFVLDEWGMDDFTSLMNYCPNCGARMSDGEERDD